MSKTARSCLGLLLAALLALTGQSMAVARGATMAGGEIILCTGQGPVSVPVDENGQPTGKPHICPDYALSLFAFATSQPDLPARPLGQAESLPIPVTPAAVTGPRADPTARAPPRRA